MPLLFFLFWVILNGRFTLEICIFGVCISAAICLFCWKFLGYSFKKEVHYYKLIGMYLVYALIVLREIFKANFDVLKIIFNGKRKVEPCLVSFTTDLKSDAARVALANSITLTPGTISVQLEGDRYVVHCLDKAFAEGLADSCFVQYLRKVESKAAGNTQKGKGK